MSVTKLVKKLKIKPGEKILLVNPPLKYSDVLKPLPEGTTITNKSSGRFSSIHAFVKSRSELNKELLRIKSLLNDKGMVWFCFPKKNFRN